VFIDESAKSGDAKVLEGKGLPLHQLQGTDSIPYTLHPKLQPTNLKP